MAIIRTGFHADNNFTIIANVMLRDKGLSLKARGLLFEILSHRQGWKVTQESLASSRDGKTSVSSAVKELKDAGILRLEQDRGERSHFGEIDYILDDSRWSAPIPDFPAAENPLPENQPLKKTNSLEDYLKPSITGFEDWWKLYPRKQVKAAAEKAYTKAVNRGATEADLLTAVGSFATEWEKRPREELKFCPYASTWLNQDRWQDYVSSAGERLAECEAFVASQDWVSLMAVLGVKVAPPDFGDVSPLEATRLGNEWWASWWSTEGRKLCVTC